MSNKIKISFSLDITIEPVYNINQTELHAQEEVEKIGEITKNIHEVKSPVVGTFYRASSPDSNPFVEVGSFVKEKEVLCIIEAMKTMNEIQAEISGKIVKIFQENAKPVEFGDMLFHIEPVESA